MIFLERYTAFFMPLALGLYLLISTFFGGDFTLIPGDLADTRFNIFILEHCYQFFTGALDSFWNAGFMYPEKEVISLSDNLLGSAPIYSVFRLTGLDVYTSFQFWAITLAILNYISAYLLVSHLSKRNWFSGIAAFVFAFSLGLAAQMNHAQTFPRFAIPLTFLFLLLWRERKHWKWFFWSLLALTYTFYCGIYLGFMNLVPYAILFIFIAIENRNSIKKQLIHFKTSLMYGVSLAVNIGLLFVLFFPYLKRSSSGGALHTYEQIKHSIPTPLSYLSAHHGTIIHEPLNNLIGGEQPAFWDHWLFSGWLTSLGILIMFFLAFKKRMINGVSSSKRNMWLLMITGSITFVMFLRVGDYSLYYLLHFLPGFGAMRSMTRIINIELLFFGIALAFLLTALAKRYKAYRILVFIVVLLLLFVDNKLMPDHAKTTSKQVMQQRHSKLISKMSHIPKGSAVSYEPNQHKIDSDIAYYQIDAMLAAQSLGLKSINGYSAKAPYSFDRFWRNPNEQTRKFWLKRFEDVSRENIYIIH